MSLLANDPDRVWEQLGATDPYYAVLTDSRYRGELAPPDRAAFFQSGADHLEHVLAIIRDRLDPAFAPYRALDFGCGVGRILVPLAERCAEVTGVDVSPAMLAEARRNCEVAGARHVRLVRSDDQLSAVEGDLDLIHTYIVLQHIPVRRGERLVEQLAARLAPGGVGIFHVTYAHAPTATYRRLLYWLRTRVPGAHAMLNLALGRSPGEPLMQGNRYSATRLLDLLWRAGCAEVHVRFSDHQGHRGVLLFARRSAASVFL
ncbi:MAG TPA: methyltransferase domain-containing protein [Gemmatimonadales bacterium]